MAEEFPLCAVQEGLAPQLAIPVFRCQVRILDAGTAQGPTIKTQGRVAMQLDGGQLVVEMLKAYGVRHVFGVPGDTGLGLYAALGQAQARGEIIHVLARDERAAAYMADVYARVSFRLGVCEGPSGAGATYLAAGLAEAHASSIPVVALCSDTPLAQEGRNVLTALDQPGLFGPITKASTLVKTASRIPDALRAAFRLATSGRPGAVQVTLPMDVLAARVDLPALHAEAACRAYPAYRTRPDLAAVEQAADLLLRAEQPRPARPPPFSRPTCPQRQAGT
jgi:acetolactate synthase-1/2/3 large subunit